MSPAFSHDITTCHCRWREFHLVSEVTKEMETKAAKVDVKSYVMPLDLSKYRITLFPEMLQEFTEIWALHFILSSQELTEAWTLFAGAHRFRGTGVALYFVFITHFHCALASSCCKATNIYIFSNARTSTIGV